MENKDKDTVLHWVRVRAKDEPEFFDAQTDFRKLLPLAYRTAADLLIIKYPDDEDYKYADACFSVYQIRIAEDGNADCATVIDGFNAAMQKLPAVKRCTLYELAMQQLLMLYGLFCRRDVKASPTDVAGMSARSAVNSIMGSLSPETAARVRDELTEKGMLQKEQCNVFDDGYVQCMENGEQIQHVKRIAAMYFDITGSGDWDSLSAACEREFSTSSIKSTPANIAVCLAYPKYGKDSLVIEERRNADELASEADSAAAKSGQ